eukprot:scaffold267280_cov30-Tisochrysis_lutea.AAC.2
MHAIVHIRAFGAGGNAPPIVEEESIGVGEVTAGATYLRPSISKGARFAGRVTGNASPWAITRVTRVITRGAGAGFVGEGAVRAHGHARAAIGVRCFGHRARRTRGGLASHAGVTRAVTWHTGEQARRRGWVERASHVRQALSPGPLQVPQLASHGAQAWMSTPFTELSVAYLPTAVQEATHLVPSEKGKAGVQEMHSLLPGPEHVAQLSWHGSHVSGALAEPPEHVQPSAMVEQATQADDAESPSAAHVFGLGGSARTEEAGLDLARGAAAVTGNRVIIVAQLAHEPASDAEAIATNRCAFVPAAHAVNEAGAPARPPPLDVAERIATVASERRIIIALLGRGANPITTNVHHLRERQVGWGTNIGVRSRLLLVVIVRRLADDGALDGPEVLNFRHRSLDEDLRGVETDKLLRSKMRRVAVGIEANDKTATCAAHARLEHLHLPNGVELGKGCETGGSANGGRERRSASALEA